MDKTNKRIGQILIDKGLITPEDLQDALDQQKVSKEFLGKILVKMKIISEQGLLEALSEQTGFACYRLKKKAIDLDLAKNFSSNVLSEHKCFPIKKDDFTITVAITNPLDVWAFSAVEKAAGLLKPKFVLITESDMDWLLEQYRRYKKMNLGQFFGE